MALTRPPRLRELGLGDVVATPALYPGSDPENAMYTFRGTRKSLILKVYFGRLENKLQGQAEALKALSRATRRCPYLTVPRPLAWGELPDDRGSFLVLDHIKLSQHGNLRDCEVSQAMLAKSLAKMHLAGAGEDEEGFGFPCETSLGEVVLPNRRHGEWAEFFVEELLEGHLRGAAASLKSKGQRRLASTLESWVADLRAAAYHHLRAEHMRDVRPSVLHGDLWTGNTACDADGNLVLLDPAGFYGHSEFDLAFQGWEASPGFPGFSNVFYLAYHDVLPRKSGFQQRKDLYQLVHLLNHLASFGIEYWPYVEGKAKRVLAD